jgi:hypothetical protein
MIGAIDLQPAYAGATTPVLLWSGIKRQRRNHPDCDSVARTSMPDSHTNRQAEIESLAPRQWQALREKLKAGMEEFQSIVTEDFGKFETVIRNDNTGEWIHFRFEPLSPPCIYSTNRYDGNHETSYRRFKKDPKDSRIKLCEHGVPDGERFLSIEDLAHECVSVLAKRH